MTSLLVKWRRARPDRGFPARVWVHRAVRRESRITFMPEIYAESVR
jgi:hypothetical protein